MTDKQATNTSAITYQNFDLPMDGQTRVCAFDDYTARNLHNEGWTMVGLCHMQDGDETTRVFGVYRRTESEGLQAAHEEMGKANKDANEARAAKNDAERQLVDAHKRIAELQARIDGEDE